MALIGTFPASASAVFNLDFLPEYFLVDGPQFAQPLSNFSVVTSGVQLMSITSQQRLTALAKYDSGAILDYDATPGTANPQSCTKALLIPNEQPTSPTTFIL